MKQRITALALLGAWLAGTIFTAAPALAATTPAAPKPAAPAGQALEIAPPVISLTVNPGETAKTVIYLRNISGSNLVVTNQLNDFVAAGQDGTPKLLLDNSKTNNPYTLKSWIAPLPSLTLVPREIKTLTVTIKVPADASPGGHYGVVRFTGTAAGLNTSGVSLSASLGSLMLVTVSGNIHESLTVDQFSVNKGGSTGHVFDSAPLNFVEVFKNTGNVHVQPTGIISVKNMFGKQLASVPVNVPPGNVLPSSSRKFSQPLDKSILGTKRLFGHYNAKLSVTYGTTKQTLTSTLGFWVIPFKFIVVIALVLVGGFLALRWLIKYYNRRVIERANRNRQQ